MKAKWSRSLAAVLLGLVLTVRVTPAGAEVAAPAVAVQVRALETRLSPVSPFSLVVTVQNNSPTQSINLESLTVESPMDFDLAGLLETKRSQQMALGEDVVAGASVEHLVPILLKQPALSWNDGTWGWMFVSAGDYNFRVMAAYKDEGGTIHNEPKEAVLRFNAPFKALMIGALAGAVLIGLLRAWLGLLRAHTAGALSPRAIAGEVAAFIGLSLPVGLLMAVLAITLARISTEFRGVLQVELNDFWAGWLVGASAQSTTGPVAEALGRILEGKR